MKNSEQDFFKKAGYSADPALAYPRWVTATFRVLCVATIVLVSLSAVVSIAREMTDDFNFRVIFATFKTTLCILVPVFVYFFPYLFAKSSHHPKAESIGLINLLLGFTIVGWIVALVRANRRDANAWREEPATEWQIKNLREFGVVVDGREFTKGEATDILIKLRKLL